MTQFTYTAAGAAGQTTTGTVSANTRDEALSMLHQKNIKPIVIHEAKANKLSFGAKRARVKNKELVIFTRQLSTMVSAGVSLIRALDTLRDQMTNKAFKEHMGVIVKDVESGISLADALGKHPGIFSPVYVSMVRAGETGGILDDILKKLAEQQEKDATIRAKVKSATTYPMVLMVITIIAFFVLTIVVIPKIGAMVVNLSGSSKLPAQTVAMLAVSNFLRHRWYVVLIACIGGPIIFNRWRRTPNGKAQFDAILLKIPVIKDIVTKVAVARFSRIFASLMGAGVSVLDSLQTTADALGNHVIQQELLQVTQEVKNGKPLSQSLAKSQFFPPIVSQMMAVGEETGKIDTVLVKVADFYEEEVDTVIESLSSILEPLMIVIMGGMVGLIAASVLGPITSLNQSIGN